MWSDGPTDGSEPVVAVEMDVTLPADGGGAGPMCGSSTPQATHYAAAVSTGDMLILGRMDGITFRELLRTSLPRGIDLTGAGPVHLRLECAKLDADIDRVAFWLDDALLLDTTMPGSIGPFDRYGMWVSGMAPASSADFDNVEVLTSEAPAG